MENTTEDDMKTAIDNSCVTCGAPPERHTNDESPVPEGVLRCPECGALHESSHPKGGALGDDYSDVTEKDIAW